MVTQSRTKGNIKPEHYCTQENEITRQGIFLERLGKVTLGNGHPEDGLLFMFREFLEHDKRKQEDIQLIKESIKDLNENNNVLLGEITRVGTDLNDFKLSTLTKKETEKELNDKARIAKELLITQKRDKRFIVFQIIALVLTLCGVSAAVYFGFHSDKNTSIIKSEQKTTNEILAPGSAGEAPYILFAKDTTN